MRLKGIWRRGTLFNPQRNFIRPLRSTSKSYRSALLERAVRKLTGKMGVDVQLGWDATNHLHVWGVPAAIGDLESQEQFNSLY
jgi:hypothetical protein